MTILEREIRNWKNPTLKEELTERLKLWVRDKTIPLDERFDLFIFSEFGDDETDIVKFEAFGEIDITYEMDLQRYRTVEMYDIIEYVEDWSEHADEDSMWYKFDINAFKEEILEKFVNSFIVDW